VNKKWVISIVVVAAVVVGIALVGTMQGSAVTGQNQPPAIKFTDKEMGSLVEISPVPAQRDGVGRLIESLGVWDLGRLGYSDLSVPCQDRYGALYVEYVLPEDAAQGTERWYVLDLDLQIEFGQDSGEGECEIKVYANNAICTKFNFYSRIEDGTLRLYHGDSVMSSLRADVTHSDYMPGHHLIVNGVQPGNNFLTVLVVKYGSIQVDSLRVLRRSSIECVDTPRPGFAAEVALWNYLPKLAADEETRARDIALNDDMVRELVAGREYSIDLVCEWDSPEVPGREGRVDICLDRVYQIEYDWPWPPLPIREDTHHDTLWVREMTVVVSLEEGKVLGIMPERHPVFLDPADLPEEMRPPDYAPEPQVEIPTLTAEEEAMAREMALNDSRVQEMLAGKGFEVAPEGRIGVWHTSDGLKKIGAVLEIRFDKACWFSCDRLREIELDEENVDYSSFLDSICSNGGLWIEGVQVLVSFEKGRVVRIVPLWQYGGEQ